MTLVFSSDTPCLATVIPAMERMRADLQVFASNYRLSAAVRAALTLGLGLLDKYYSLTDHSEAYRIAIGALLSHIVFHTSSTNHVLYYYSSPSTLQTTLL